MAIIFDVVQGSKYEKDGEEKTRWRNLGVAFEKEGKISSLKLEALPLPDKNGEVWLNIFEQKPKNSFSSSNNKLDDEIPF